MLQEKCQTKSCGTNARCNNPLNKLQAENTTTATSHLP